MSLRCHSDVSGSDVGWQALEEDEEADKEEWGGAGPCQMVMLEQESQLFFQTPERFCKPKPFLLVIHC